MGGLPLATGALALALLAGLAGGAGLAGPAPYREPSRGNRGGGRPGEAAAHDKARRYGEGLAAYERKVGGTRVERAAGAPCVRADLRRLTSVLRACRLFRAFS